MNTRKFVDDRFGSTAVIVGLIAPVLLAMAGLSIDFAGVMSAKTKIELSADAGALTGIMTAGNALITDPGNYIADGETAAKNRFAAQTGNIPTVTTPTATMVVTRNGPTLSGTLTWSATYIPFFGKLFGVTSWPLSGTSSVTAPIATPYLNVEVMLDNSPSMEIGATNTDIATLQALTACSASGAYIPTSSGTWTSPDSGQAYNAYQCSASGENYDGGLTCPIPQPSPPYSNPITFQPAGVNSTWDAKKNPSPSCAGLLPAQTTGTLKGQYPQAGAPCAFACHFDTTKPAGEGNDYYGVARSTIGKSDQVTLRFDVVKSAVNTLITSMQSNNNTALNNLNVGVFTFDHALIQVYPASGEAGNGWQTALAAVGAPPTTANGPDTGIQPYGGDNGGDTDYPDTMSTLASTLTPSGDGTTAQTPRKVLFLVTDGVQDYTNAAGERVPQAMNPSYCTTFKNMNYEVFVLYTPYYPLMNAYYLENMVNVVEGTGSGTVAAALQACASTPQDYIQASDPAAIQSALQQFFQIALTNAPAKFSH